ncbi:MAG TPA: nuclear transport factor 2 family protein [Kineosporiaceae bacterium]|nr:nuclear transport factor 2 family protein [Kineosporiaceae bacterium]
MSAPTNIALVRRLYESRMAPEVTKEVIAPDLVWDITPGFPNSGVYHGWDDVAENFFGPIMPNYESFGAVPEEYFGDDDNHVFVFGHYHAEAKQGSTADVRFIHLWTVRDGQLVRMRQAADSYVLRQLLNA